jgi:hypothetical protein
MFSDQLIFSSTMNSLLISFFILMASMANLRGPQLKDDSLIPARICLSEYEQALFEELNKYRAQHKLPALVLSHSLTLVAQTHCRDLQINQPHRRSNCNMHSWSNRGPWTACCYTSDHRRSSCMWSKPSELTPYKSDGFEIAFYSTARYPDAKAFAADAVQSWSKSKGHNDVIINKGTWRDVEWKAVGIGHYGEFAAVWFGETTDPVSDIPGRCE